MNLRSYLLVALVLASCSVLAIGVLPPALDITDLSDLPDGLPYA